MSGISPWAVAALKEFSNKVEKVSLFNRICNEYTINLYCIENVVWVHILCPDDCIVILRAAYSPGSLLEIKKTSITENGVQLLLKSALGEYSVHVQLPEKDQSLIRYTTSLTPAENLLFPFCPRDLIIGTKGKNKPEGNTYISQKGTRSGIQYFSLDNPDGGSALYLQNLTALNDYFQATETSAADTVGGQWPELGFSLPPTKEKAILKGKEIILSDAFLALSPVNSKDETSKAKLFLDLLAQIYIHLPRPETQYHDWLDLLKKGLKDLESQGCWTHNGGHDYLNAYVGGYKTPPELMVQLAVLLPLLDYKKWSKNELLVIKKLKDGLNAFYEKDIGTVVRFLPSMEKDLDGSEEQLQPNVIDSWYLHHPLLNLSRMALDGDNEAEKLFLDSLPFCIKVAHHFKYEWPVFYNMKTLEVIKAETKPGKGGEKDVAGLYAHVMLQAWDLTKNKKYLLEAEKAARTLHGKGFDLFYQANNTAFSANALLRLFQETSDIQYLDLSYLCIAGIMANLQLWECDYGFAKSYPTFFGVFPLSDAPYTAAYEEQEVFSSFHNFLLCSEKDDILPSVKLLLSEFIRYVCQRASFYYPPNLPSEMIAEKAKTGEVDTKLYIAIEDIHDGWEKSGEVGQEVYGAGVAFGIVPRHYYQIPDQPIFVFLDYPTSGYKYKIEKSLSLIVKGDDRLQCRMVILQIDNKELPKLIVACIESGGKNILKPKKKLIGRLEYLVNGNQALEISWE